MRFFNGLLGRAFMSTIIIQEQVFGVIDLEGVDFYHF